MSHFSPQLLQETAASVLADCAFLMLDPVAVLPPVEGAAVVTTLSFTGAVSGALRLCAPRQMLLGAAADMLGQAPDDSQANEEAEATLSELTNVLLGVLLARAFGARECPSIGLPRSASTASVEDAPEALCSAVLVDMAGLPLVVSILASAEVAA